MILGVVSSIFEWQSDAKIHDRDGSEVFLPTVSVIIVNYNGRDDLSELFVSLERQTHQANEVILVDNASSDGSVDYVRELFPWVQIVALARNVGFAEGNNEGLARASGDYIALLNPDTIADEQWLDELVIALESDGTNAAAVPKIYQIGSPKTIEQAGGEFNNLGHFWTRGFNQRRMDNLIPQLKWQG